MAVKVGRSGVSGVCGLSMRTSETLSMCWVCWFDGATRERMDRSDGLREGL